MKRRRLSPIYPLLILLITGLACSMTSSSGAREKPMPTRPRYVVLPSASPTLVPGLSELSLPEQTAPPVVAPVPLPSPRLPRPTATPTPVPTAIPTPAPETTPEATDEDAAADEAEAESTPEAEDSGG